MYVILRFHNEGDVALKIIFNGTLLAKRDENGNIMRGQDTILFYQKIFAKSSGQIVFQGLMHKIQKKL